MLKVILLSLTLSTRLFAAESALDKKIHHFEELSKLFREICFEANGTFRENQVVIIPQSSLVKTAFNCNDQALALAEYYKKLQAEIDEAEVEDCPAIDDPTSSITGSTGQALDRLNCPGKFESNRDCYGSVACNVFKSFIPGADIASKGLVKAATTYYQSSGLDFSKSSAYSTLNQCSNSSGGTCGTEIARGIWDNLYSTVVGIWNLVKMAGSGLSYLGEKVADKAKDGYYYAKKELFKLFNKQEDQTSRRAIAATEISDSELDHFLDDPFGYLKKMVSAMMDAGIKHIKSTYGCQEWSGTPHFSTCLIPMQNWDCGTCQQKLNTACGVVGYFAGNLVTNYFCGGAAALYTGFKSAAGTALSSKMASSLSSFPGKGLITATGQVLSRSGKLVSAATIAAWNGVKNSAVTQTVSDVAKKLAGKGTVAGDFTKLVFVESNTAILTKKMVMAYYNISVDATKLGYNHTLRAGQMIQTKVSLLYPRFASIDQNQFLKQYLDATKVPQKDRKHYELRKSEDGRAYVIDKRELANNSKIAAAKEPQPEAIADNTEIVVTARRKPAQASPEAPLTTTVNLEDVNMSAKSIDHLKTHLRVTDEQDLVLERLTKDRDPNLLATLNVPFRKTETTLFPKGHSAEEIMQSLKEGRKIQIKSNDPRHEVFKVEHQGSIYKVVVCKDVKCVYDDMTIKQNEVRTIFPECGPEVISLVSVTGAQKVLAKNREITKDDFFEKKKCRPSQLIP